MSKEIRSISAHEPILKQAKLFTQRYNHKPLLPENQFYDKESLYYQVNKLKEENNLIKYENIKLKTRIQQYDREMQNYEKYFEEIQKQQRPNNQKNLELTMLQLKKQNKELQTQLNEKNILVEQFKKNIKVTKVQELEIENKVFKEEIKKLKELLQQKEQSFKDQFMKSSRIKENFYKTQQEFVKNQQELKELKVQSQKDSDKIITLQTQVQKLNQTKLQLEDKIRKTVTEQNKKSSSNSFRSHKLQATTEISCAQIKTKLQEELQYKLIVRGITYEQFVKMICELKIQADNIKKEINKEDIEYILSQEPFSLQQERIDDVLKMISGSGHKLADQFLNLIGKYKTFFDYPNFKIEEAEIIISKSLKSQEAVAYVQANKRKIWGKEDISQFVNLLFNWDESTTLFYYLNLFEKAGQTLDFDLNLILDPFPTQQESSKIMEESEEDLFDQYSQSNDKSDEVE